MQQIGRVLRMRRWMASCLAIMIAASAAWAAAPSMEEDLPTDGSPFSVYALLTPGADGGVEFVGDWGDRVDEFSVIFDEDGNVLLNGDVIGCGCPYGAVEVEVFCVDGEATVVVCDANDGSLLAIESGIELSGDASSVVAEGLMVVALSVD